MLTFRYLYAKQETITHRIVDIDEHEGGGYRIELRGDNAADAHSGTQVIYTQPDAAPEEFQEDAIYNFVIGKVVAHSEFLGSIAYALKSKVGIICFILVPCLIIIILEIIKIVKLFSEEKQRKAQEVNAAQHEKIEAQETELAELKKQLEALQKEKSEPKPTVETSETTEKNIENKSEGE